MYSGCAQGVVERVINVRYYYYYNTGNPPTSRQGFPPHSTSRKTNKTRAWAKRSISHFSVTRRWVCRVHDLVNRVTYIMKSRWVCRVHDLVHRVTYIITLCVQSWRVVGFVVFMTWSIESRIIITTLYVQLWRVVGYVVFMTGSIESRI